MVRARNKTKEKTAKPIGQTLKFKPKDKEMFVNKSVISK